jgi:hypothetical protein
MPNFSAVVVQQPNANNWQGPGRARDVPAGTFLVEDREIAFVLINPDPKTFITMMDSTFPQMCCACTKECNLQPVNNTNGAFRSREKLMRNCGICNLRLPGSAASYFLDAAKGGYTCFKLRFCPISARPMVYVTMQSGGLPVVRCGYQPCQCLPIPLPEILAPPSTVTVLPDKLLKYLSERGLSTALSTPPASRASLEMFEDACGDIVLFRPIEECAVPKLAKKVVVPKKVEPVKAAKKSAPPAKKGVSVKTVTKAKSAAKKSASKKKAIKAAKVFIDDEAEEGSEDESMIEEEIVDESAEEDVSEIDDE